MQPPKHDQVRSRNEPFVQKTATRIWYEEPAPDNPFIATHALCHGYDLFELMQKRSIVDVFICYSVVSYRQLKMHNYCNN